MGELLEHLNFSCYEETKRTPIIVFYYMLAAGAVLLTVCGNLLVIISICHFQQLHTPTNLLLLSLAATDLLIGLVVMPFSFSDIIQKRWLFSTTLCLFHSVTGFSLTFVSIYNVALIAVDRFIMLHDPFFYANKITLSLASATIFVLWIGAVLYNAALVFANFVAVDLSVTVLNSTGATEACGPVKCSAHATKAWAAVDLAFSFAVPCGTIVILYVRIFTIVSKHAQSIQGNTARHAFSVSARKGKPSVTSERKAAKNLGILITAFLLCMVPSCVSAVVDPAVFTGAQYDVFSNASYWLVLINSLINPVIYALFYPWFQRSVRCIVTCTVCTPGSSLVNVLVEKY